MKKGKPPSIPMNTSFSDPLDCVTGMTDEENEDLPCDGDLEGTCHRSSYSADLSHCACIGPISDIFFNVSCSEENKNTKASADAETHPQAEAAFNCHARAPEATGIWSKTPAREAPLRSEFCAGGFGGAGRKEHLADSKMSDVLLRHFPKGDLISTCQLIECETIPELSFTDSIDEASGKLGASELAQSPLPHGQPLTNLENHRLEKCEKIDTWEKDHTLLNSIFASKRAISASECRCIQRSSPLPGRNEDRLVFQNPTKEQRDPFKRTASSPCGESEVHYCLPRFSEIAKEPERNSNNKPAPVTEKTKAFPILSNKSVTVDDTVENMNGFDSAEIKNQEEMSVSELLQHLQMLTDHADTQNHIDQLRFNPKIFSQSAFPNPSFAMYSRGTEISSGVFALHSPMRDLSEAGLQCGAMLSTLPSAGTTETRYLNPSSSLPELTQGEKMTQILKEQTAQLKKKVLNHLKRCLDALEQSYLIAKEEHCNLQLQNNTDKSISVGKFDPERKVEGEIFRLGMLLENIHEETDGSKSISPPLLTSYESAHSSYSLWEGSGNSSIIDPPEETAVETAFLHKNKEKNLSHTTDAIPWTNHKLSLEGDNYNPYLQVQLTLQKKDELTSKRDMQPLVRGGLLANKHSPNVMQRFLSPEEMHAAQGLGSYTVGKLSQKSKPDEESMKSNENMQERKTERCSTFIQGQPTDLSDTNLSSDSEDISACDSYNDSQSEELLNNNHKTENHTIFSTRERKEIKQRCTRGIRDEFKLRKFKEFAQPCALCRNQNPCLISYSQKRISLSQKPYRHKQPYHLVNTLSERKNMETAKSCYSSTYDTVILSPQYPPRKTTSGRRSAVNIQNRNISISKANILSSTLDHAIETANSLKRTTERMVQAVSEDLAKVRSKQL